MAPFERNFITGWADIDFNGHMRNSAYLDRASDVRTMFLASHGVTIEEFYRLRVGPVVKHDQVEYFREVKLLDPLRVTYALAGMSDDGSRFRLRNEVWRADGQIAARITSVGGWLDLTTRKLVAPPKVIFDTVNHLERTTDFEQLPSSLRQ